MKSKKGFTLIELMVVVLIVGILAAVAIPILRGRIDAAKWSEGKAMMGSIATAVRAYVAENGTGSATLTLDTTDILSTSGLGFADGDLTGTYFVDGDFELAATYDPAANPSLTFTVTCTPSTSKAPSNPPSYTLDQDGNFTPGTGT